MLFFKVDNMVYCNSDVKQLGYIVSNIYGKRCEYGLSMFGDVALGTEFLGFNRTPFGNLVFGESKFGDYFQLSGIYARRWSPTGNKTIRMPYYVPNNPRTSAQQTNRAKMGDAVVFWQNLTTEQKNAYNRLAVGKHMTGFNLCTSEYLKTH
jgi:hypothetical protein